MRIRKVESKEKKEELIDDYITLGYRVVTEGEGTTKMKKTQYGGIGAHILIFIFTVWFTLGLANVAYAVYCYYTGDEVLMKISEG
ncbi:MAG: hypothetical protein Q4P17_04785 [Methanobacterium sp.]|nr:hypothetical protein [Methanobacterium sp.]